ncbi:MAG: DNA topoisomerase IB [Dehalococcoidia bacterium]
MVVAVAPPGNGQTPATIAAPAVAKAAGLRYVSDATPGITRKQERSGFAYAHPDGQPLRDEGDLRRVKALAIPPAWSDVWISPHANGHLQATGRDARGRKQYRYHTTWSEVRDQAKFGRMLDFAAALPGIRQRVEADLARPGLPREKVLAAVVRLLEITLIRVGNEEYARQNKSFGLTTFRNRHVSVSGATLRFKFTGKHGKTHDVGIRNRQLAGIIKRCQELPGQELFQYLDDDGQRQAIGSSDVNDYLRAITDSDFTAKDFRTWAGTVLAALALHEFGAPQSETQAKHNVLRAIEFVAARLGNTPAISRKCYVHPAVLDAYNEGALEGDLLDIGDEARDAVDGGLTSQEAAVIALLQQRASAAAA